jgi:5-methylcytosine-specific restriction endonuclease McrA
MSVSIRSLSDSDLLFRVKDLTTRERALTLSLLLHLNEVERRKLHLKQGFSSMFDYCTAGLGYSEPAAFRRIRTARCVARFPEVYGLLESNEVSLNSVARVSRVLTAANKDALLTRIRGKSQREVEAIVAEHEPCARFRDVVRPVVLRVSTQPAASAGVPTIATGAPEARTVPSLLDATENAAEVGATLAGARENGRDDACEKSAYFPREGDLHPTGLTTERRVQFQFAASEAFREKFERVKSLAWHRLPANASLEQVFELALDALIARHDPRARRERRLARGEARVVRSRQANSGSRYLAASVKEEVFTRDEGQCAFIGSNGRRCESRHALQIDHIKPFARGGTSTVDNLRLLCAYHNRLEAERLMGPLASMSTQRRK